MRIDSILCTFSHIYPYCSSTVQSTNGTFGLGLQGSYSDEVAGDEAWVLGTQQKGLIFNTFPPVVQPLVFFEGDPDSLSFFSRFHFLVKACSQRKLNEGIFLSSLSRCRTNQRMCFPSQNVNEQFRYSKPFSGHRNLFTSQRALFLGFVPTIFPREAFILPFGFTRHSTSSGLRMMKESLSMSTWHMLNVN